MHVQDETYRIDPCAHLRREIEHLRKNHEVHVRMLERFLEASRELLKDGTPEKLEKLVEMMALADLIIARKNKGDDEATTQALIEGLRKLRGGDE